MIGIRFTYRRNGLPETTLTVVIPRDNPYWQEAAHAFLDYYDGNKDDHEYHLMNVETFEVHAILQDVTTLQG